MKYADLWNDIHTKYQSNEIVCDDWLDKYLPDIKRCGTKALDLGCGLGNNTLYLKKHGLDVISLDYSNVALDYVKSNIKGSTTCSYDISEPLPFDDNSFDLIVADLSLHYFSEEATIKIMKEIKRILTPEGLLIARVNSVKDINYGANKGEQIEPNFYHVDGYDKRFFNLVDAIKFFSYVGDTKVIEGVMTRYSLPKFVYEIVAEKQ